ncbi:MAG: HAD family phosphatase [Kiritimatiellae bacterium]|nr:HAD family phosphatase [Kiritimatiellia bacterium]
MRPAAFLFDLDGTLVDTETAWAKAMVDMIVARGGCVTLSSLLPLIVGRNWLDIHAAIHEMFPVLGETSAMEDALELREYYRRHAADPASMRIEGSIAFFRKAAAIAPCAIVSGSPAADVKAAAELCGISSLVSLILGAGDYPKGKPDPSGYLCAAKRLGVKPEDCVVIEDSSVGVASGVAAGMKVVALDRRGAVPQVFRGETWRVGDLSEIDAGKEFAA